jgi:hypothetical protein
MQAPIGLHVDMQVDTNVLEEHWYLSVSPHSTTNQKTNIDIFTAVRISNLTFLVLWNFNSPRWQILISNWSILSHSEKYSSWSCSLILTLASSNHEEIIWGSYKWNLFMELLVNTDGCRWSHGDMHDTLAVNHDGATEWAN